MNKAIVNQFVGRLAADPVLNIETAKFTLIRNEYAGKDEQGNATERVLSVQFVAFGSAAKGIAYAKKGDQLFVSYTLENNNYTDGQGVDRYGYNFKVQSFEFGAKAQSNQAVQG